MSETDMELLARYTRRQHAEDAFAELVRRHLGLVYSAALRQVRSRQLAEEIAQSAFVKLARQAARLKPDTILTAWLYQVTRHDAIDVVRREASRQLREQIATQMNAMNATADDWTHIEPLLDEAMHALDETDRAAVLLRYFENKSLREVGATIGTSENAAQKRLGRAVERLREFFAKRGVTVTSGLVVVISAHAVQAVPVGLALTISTTAALAGPGIVTTATATKLAMTTLQKTLMGAVLVAAVGTGIYEARRASTFQNQVTALEQQRTELAEQLTRDRDDAAGQLTAERNSSIAELVRLRGEVARLRRDPQERARLNVNSAEPTNEFPWVAAILVTNTGPRSVTDEQIRARIQTQVGDAFDRSNVDRDVRDLYETGRFSNIRVIENKDGSGITLTYAVAEVEEGPSMVVS